MDSELDSSSITPSTSQTSSRTRGISAHKTWSHSRWGIASNGEDPKKHYCLHCEEEGKERGDIYSNNVTTNFRGHLLAKHQIIVEREENPIRLAVRKQLKSLYLEARSSGEAKEINTQVFQDHLDQDAID